MKHNFLYQEIGEYPKLQKFSNWFSKIVFIIFAAITIFVGNPVDITTEFLVVGMILVILGAVLSLKMPSGSKPNVKQFPSIIRILALIVLGVSVLVWITSFSPFWVYVLIAAYLIRIASVIETKNISYAVMWMIVAFVFLLVLGAGMNYFENYLGLIRSIYYFVTSFLI